MSNNTLGRFGVHEDVHCGAGIVAFVMFAVVALRFMCGNFYSETSIYFISSSQL